MDRGSDAVELVSVIIPAFNAERYLRETLDSVLAQTWPACEVIVVDDGSTDSTPAILSEYAGRIRVLRQDNQGSATARNTAVSAASGAWIAFIDADDVWLPGKLTRQMQHCGRYAISHTDSVCFGDGLPREVLRSAVTTPYAGRVLKQLLVTNFISNSTVMMRRDVFLQYGGLNESLPGVEDWSLWLRVCADYELGYLPEPLVRYRIHRQSKSMNTRKRMADHLHIIDEAFGPTGVGRSLRRLRRRALASSFEINGHFAAESGDWTFAAWCAAQRLRYQPWAARGWKNLAKSALIPLGIRY